MRTSEVEIASDVFSPFPESLYQSHNPVPRQLTNLATQLPFPAIRLQWALLVWIHLKQIAIETKKTVYHLKYGLLADYLRQQLKSPTIQVTFA